MSEVFICEKGQLTQPSKKQLRDAGILVAEVTDITRVQFVRASEIIGADDMLWAALQALSVKSGSYGRDQREQLARNLLTVVEANRKKQP